MHRSESRELVACADCGAEIDPSRGRCYGLSSDAFLCCECAIRRGGSYDELHDRWPTPPDTGDLLRPEE